MADCPSTPGCPGDAAFASPGHGHLDVCQHPRAYDGFRSTTPTTDAMAGAMTVVYLFGAAVRDGTPEQRENLAHCKEMLERREPFKDVGQAILDAMGPLWTPDPETMAAIEAVNRKD